MFDTYTASPTLAFFTFFTFLFDTTFNSPHKAKLLQKYTYTVFLYGVLSWIIPLIWSVKALIQYYSRK